MIQVLVDETAVHTLVFSHNKKEVARYPINPFFVSQCKNLTPPTREKETYRCTFDGNVQLSMPYVFRFVEKYQKQPMTGDRIQTPLKHLKLPVQIWYTRFVQEIFEKAELVEEMVKIANRLKIEPLLLLLCANIANKLVNRTPREIYTMFQTDPRSTPFHPDHILFGQKWKYGFRALDPAENVHLPSQFIAIYDSKFRTQYRPFQLIYDLIPGNIPEISIDDIAGAGHCRTLRTLNRHPKKPIYCSLNAIGFAVMKGHVHILQYFLDNPDVVDLDEPFYPATVNSWIETAEQRNQAEVAIWLRQHADDLEAAFFTEDDEEEEEEDEEEEQEEPCSRNQHAYGGGPSSKNAIRVVV